MNQNGHFPNEGTMKDQQQADELNAFLDELQAGQMLSHPDSLPADQVELLLKLQELAAIASPSTEFVNQLQANLQLATLKNIPDEIKTQAGNKPDLIQVTSQQPFTLRWREILAGLIRMFAMKKNMQIAEVYSATRIDSSSRKMPHRMAFAAMIGAVVLVILLVILLPKLGGFGQRTSPPALAILPATETQIQRTATQLVISPSITPLPNVLPTDLPTALPTIVVIKPDGLPRLAALTGGGIGGSGGSYLAKLRFQLNISLPESPAVMPIYQSAQLPMTIETASQVARQLGMQPNLYLMQNDLAMYKTDPSSLKTLFAMDGSRRLIFEGSGSYYLYHDDRFSLYHLGHWYPAEPQPSAEQINTNVLAFMEKYNLLDFPYQIKPYSGGFPSIQFIQTIDGKYPVYPSVTSIEIGRNGEVGDYFTYRSAHLLPVDEYKILTAQEAWQLLQKAPSEEMKDERVWYWVSAKTFTQCNPQYWKPTYTDGQRADLYGTPEIFLSIDETQPAHVTLNQVILTGNLPVEVNPMHVWGEFESAGDYLVLRAEGWEVFPQAEGTWNGVIQRQGERVTLQAGDGNTYTLVGVPASLPAGSRVFVNGNVVNRKLEWNIIQADLSESDLCMMPGQSPEQILASVDQIDLIYFVPPLEGFRQDYIQVALDYAQPAWRFRGTTDNGMNFEAWVQAVAEEYLK